MIVDIPSLTSRPPIETCYIKPILSDVDKVEREERWQFLVEVFGYIPCETYIHGSYSSVHKGDGVLWRLYVMYGLRAVAIVFYDAQNEGVMYSKS